jgi:hypothetical protein
MTNTATAVSSSILGDFNCHYFDPIQWGLELGLPETIEAKAEDETYDPKTNHETYLGNVVVRYGFAAAGKRPAVTVTWYGNSAERPPMPQGWKTEDKLPDPTGGGIIIGTQGAILYGKIFHSLPDKPTPGVVRLFPDDLPHSRQRRSPVWQAIGQSGSRAAKREGKRRGPTLGSARISQGSPCSAISPSATKGRSCG